MVARATGTRIRKHWLIRRSLARYRGTSGHVH
jgi:hypothetical protein